MDKGVSSYEHVNKSDSSQSVEGRHVIRITIQGKPLGVGIFKDKEGKYRVNNVNENSLAYLEGIKKGMELVEINNKNPAVMDFEKLISVIKKASKVKPVSISFVTVADMETADDIVQNLSPSPASMSKTNGRVDGDRLKFDNNYKEDVNDSNNSNNNEDEVDDDNDKSNNKNNHFNGGDKKHVESEDVIFKITGDSAGIFLTEDSSYKDRTLVRFKSMHKSQTQTGKSRNKITTHLVSGKYQEKEDILIRVGNNDVYGMALNDIVEMIKGEVRPFTIAFTHASGLFKSKENSKKRKSGKKRDKEPIKKKTKHMQDNEDVSATSQSTTSHKRGITDDSCSNKRIKLIPPINENFAFSNIINAKGLLLEKKTYYTVDDVIKIIIKEFTHKKLRLKRPAYGAQRVYIFMNDSLTTDESHCGLFGKNDEQFFYAMINNNENKGMSYEDCIKWLLFNIDQML